MLVIHWYQFLLYHPCIIIHKLLYPRFDIYDKISTPLRKTTHPLGINLSEEILIFIFTGENIPLNNSMIGLNLNFQPNIGNTIKSKDLHFFNQMHRVELVGFFSGDRFAYNNERIGKFVNFTSDTTKVKRK